MTDFLLEQQQLPEQAWFTYYKHLVIEEDEAIVTSEDFTNLCIILYLANEKEKVDMSDTFTDIFNTSDYADADIQQNTYLCGMELGVSECVTHRAVIGTRGLFYLYIPPLYQRFVYVFHQNELGEVATQVCPAFRDMYEAFAAGVTDVARKIVNAILWQVAVVGADDDALITRDLPTQKWDLSIWAERADYASIYDLTEDVYSGGFLHDILPDDHCSFKELADAVIFSVDNLALGAGFGTIFDNFDSYFSNFGVSYSISSAIEQRGYETILDWVRGENRRRIAEREHGWKKQWHTLPGTDRSILPEYRHDPRSIM